MKIIILAELSCLEHGSKCDAQMNKCGPITNAVIGLNFAGRGAHHEGQPSFEFEAYWRSVAVTLILQMDDGAGFCCLVEPRPL